jgi:AcrR family transcriptional regulator
MSDSVALRKSDRMPLPLDSKRRIRNVASQLMVERGYVGTTISAIARRSGLPASSLYWHFGSKEGLLIAVAKEGTAKWLALIPDWRGLSGSTPERLDQMLQEWARHAIERPELVRILFMLYLERGNMSAAAAKVIYRVRETAIDKLRPAMAALLETVEDIDRSLAAENLSNFCLSFMNGCFVDHQIAPETTDLNQRFFQLRVLLLKMAKELASITRLPDTGR